MNNPNTLFDRLQRGSVMSLYAIVCIGLFIIGLRLLQNNSTYIGEAFAIYIILFLIVSITLGSWFWVTITIPGGVAREFDAIKNKIATGEISSVDDFSEALGMFLIRYFHFVGFDIVLTVIKIKYGKTFVSDSSLGSDAIKNMEWINLSKSTQDIVSLGRSKFSGQKLHGYIIPIWFGNEWLGYITIYTETKLMRIYRQYLKVFEDLYIDDQVLHVLHTNDNSNTQRLCHEIDNFSSLIEDKSVSNTHDYLKKLLVLLLSETGCKAGFIQLPGNQTVTAENIEESLIQTIDTPESDKTFRPGIPDFEIATIKKITLPDHHISIVLLDNNYESIILARSMLDSCLAIKIKKQYVGIRG